MQAPFDGTYLLTMQAASVIRDPLPLLRPRWVDPPPISDESVRVLADGLRLPAPICRLLARRGHIDVSGAKAFLRPEAAHLHDPGLMAGIGDAVERIAAAVRAGERILVHGDYDVDGICATALITRALTMMGGKPVPFVPHRLRDGYDLTGAGIAAALSAGARLIVTADCGIVAHAAVDQAARAGIDVIVTDHHTPGPTLPSALAVINPNRRDCLYPEKGLAGAGVAYKLVTAVADALGFPSARLTSLLDLVAVATVADLAPLVAENRALVRWGSAVLARTPNAGLRALLQVTGLADKDTITAGQIGFILAPRINAVGRLDDAMTGVRLLLTDEPREAHAIATELEGINQRRKELDTDTLKDALGMLERNYDPGRDWGVVLASRSWHPGVIGIVASRIVERIHRPTVLIALGSDEGRGSARSIPGFHMHEAFVRCGSHLMRFGGHRAAAGCSIDPSRVDGFRDAFSAVARHELSATDPMPELRLDGEISLPEANFALCRLLRHFGPFGLGNPSPVFAAYDVRLAGRPRTVGRQHLKLELTADGEALEAIGFGMADRLSELGGDDPRLDVAFKLEENRWEHPRARSQGPRVQARLVDFRRVR